MSLQFGQLTATLPSFHPRMVPAGYARVLVTSSVESQQGSPGYMPYNAAKWSLMAFQEEWVNTHTVNAQTNIQNCDHPARHRQHQPGLHWHLW